MNQPVPPTNTATSRHRGWMTTARETANLLGNTSGIPLLLPRSVVHQPRCIECQSLNTWTLPSAAPGTYRPMVSRMCDDCGRCTSAYTDK